MSKTGERLTGYAFSLIGVVYVLSSIGMMYFLIMIGGLLETVGALAAYGGAQIPTFTTYLAAGWAFTILHCVSP